MRFISCSVVITNCLGAVIAWEEGAVGIDAFAFRHAWDEEAAVGTEASDAEVAWEGVAAVGAETFAPRLAWGDSCCDDFAACDTTKALIPSLAPFIQACRDAISSQGSDCECILTLGIPFGHDNKTGCVDANGNLYISVSGLYGLTSDTLFIEPPMDQTCVNATMVMAAYTDEYHNGCGKLPTTPDGTVASVTLSPAEDSSEKGKGFVAKLDHPIHWKDRVYGFSKPTPPKQGILCSYNPSLVMIAEVVFPLSLSSGTDAQAGGFAIVAVMASALYYWH